MTIEELKVIITGETAGLRAALKSVQKEVARTTKGVSQEVNKVSNTIKSSVNKISNSFKSLASVLTKALSITALTLFGKKAIELASDIEEVQNVVDVAFGDMSSQVEFFAKRCAAAFGLSELQAKRAASTFMAMSTAMGINRDASKTMSLQLAALTGDMASFYNVSQDIADTALQSVFTGETETLKRFGIVMTEANLEAYRLAQGITTSYKAMSQAEKVAIRYNYVMDQTALAQGDFVRTSGSWANQLRLLKMRWEELMTAMGTILNHVLLPIVKVLNVILSQIVAVAKAWAAMFSPNKEMKKIESNGGGFSSVGSSIDEATKKAKEYKRTVAGFDELNLLNAPPKDSGAEGGAGGGLDIEIKEPYDFNALAGSMDTAAQTIQNVVDTINNGIESVYSHLVSWEDNFAKAGSSVAGFANQVIDGLNIPLIGAAIGQGINDINQFLYNALSDTKFSELGVKIGVAIQQAFDTINWDLMGKTIAAKINAMWTFLSGVVAGLDPTKIGNDLATLLNSAVEDIDAAAIISAVTGAINGIFTTINTLVNNANFDYIVDKIASTLVVGLKNIDFQLIGDTIHDVIITGLHAITFVAEDGTSVAAQVGKSIADAIKGLNIGEILSAAFEAVKTALQGFWTEMFGSELLGDIATKITLIGVAIAGMVGPATNFAAAIAAWKLSEIFPFLGNISQGFKDARENGFGFFSSLKNGLNESTGFFGGFKTAVTDAFSSVGEYFGKMNADWSPKFTALCNNLKHPIDNIIAPALGGLKTKILTTFDSMKVGTSTAFTNIKNVGINSIKTMGSAIAHPIATMKTAFSGLFGLIAANPFTALVVVIGTVVAAFIHAYKTSDDFKARIDALYAETIKPVIDSVKELIGDLWNNHLKPIADKLFVGEGSLLHVLIDIIGKILDVVANVVEPIAEVLLPMFSEAFTTAIGIIGDVLGGLLTALEGLIDFVAGVFTGDWSRAWDGVKNIFKGVFDALIGIAKAPINTIIGFINAMVRGVVGGVNAMIRAINKLHWTVPDWVPLIGGSTFGFNIKEVTAPQIPKLADGGVLYEPTIAEMGEYPGAKNNPEIVTPQNIMMETMGQAMLPMVNALIAKGNEVIKAIEDKETDIYMDTTKVAKKITKEQKQQASLSDSSLVLV